MSPLAVLVGPPGAGKSAVGALLAARLGVAWCDTDDAVAATAGMSVPEIFVERGEPVFRDLERAAVRDALASCPGIVTVGGGAVMDPGTRAALTAERVIFLDVTLGEAVRRIGLDTPRPVLLDSPREGLRRLLAARRPVYEALASAVVDTTGRAPDEVAAHVAELLGSEPSP